jgi:hypothetical protein
MQSLFSPSWSWDEYPPELKAQYEKELLEYVEKIPASINARTELPRNDFYLKFIPLEDDLKTLRENRKTPEQKQAEESAKIRHQNEIKAAQEKRDSDNIIYEKEKEEAIKKYPFLTVSNGKYDSAPVSKNIKTILSRLWPSIKWSVTHESFSMGDSVSVKWIDGPSEKQVENTVGCFVNSRFDGMTDMSEYVSNSMHVFGSTKFMHYRRAFSQEKINSLLPAVKMVVDNGSNPDADRTIPGTAFSVYGVNDGSFHLSGPDHYEKNFKSFYGDIPTMITTTILE